MKKKKSVRLNLFFIIILIVVILAIFICSDCFAMEGESEGRKLWNNIMMWVNFGILVFLFIKFAKKPLMGFLHGESKKIGKKIEDVESQVKKARNMMEEEAEKLKDIDSQVEDIKNHIIIIGRREKEKIIEKARNTANQMVEDAKKESEYKLELAKKRFSEEMLDMAVSLAVGELRKSVTPDDNERMVEAFTLGLSAEKRRFA